MHAVGTGHAQAFTIPVPEPIQLLSSTCEDAVLMGMMLHARARNNRNQDKFWELAENAGSAVEPTDKSEFRIL